MKGIQTIRKGLDEIWQTMCRSHWRCAAQKQFDTGWVKPMLAEIDRLDREADEITDLCEAAAEAAASVREPEEEDETWQRD